MSTSPGAGHLLKAFNNNSGTGRQHRRDTGQAAAEGSTAASTPSAAAAHALFPARNPPGRKESVALRGGDGGGSVSGNNQPRESAATIALYEKRHIENRRHIGSQQKRK